MCIIAHTFLHTFLALKIGKQWVNQYVWEKQQRPQYCPIEDSENRSATSTKETSDTAFHFCVGFY